MVLLALAAGRREPPPIHPRSLTGRLENVLRPSRATVRRLYISRGVGHLIRVRFNVRPEVTSFRLQSS